MNFKAHISGGIITGTVVTTAAFVLSTPLALPAPPWVLAQIFGVTVFFSLFPDLDVGSIPQRWFFRGLFITLIILAYYERYAIATLLALVSITPLLDHHRSWTHSIFSVLWFPVALAALYEYVLVKDHFLYQWSLDHIRTHLSTHIWLVLACMLGWYTHLFLDLRILRTANNRR